MSKLAERCVRETFLGIDLWRRNTAPPTSQNTPLSLITFVYNHSVLSFEMWHLRRTNPCPIGQLQARTSAASLTSNSLKIDGRNIFFRTRNHQNIDTVPRNRFLYHIHNHRQFHASSSSFHAHDSSSRHHAALKWIEFKFETSPTNIHLLH